VAAELTRRLAPGWYDEGDLLVRAAARVDDGLPTRLARLVVYLPERLRALELDLLRTLGSAAELQLFVGVTGVGAADDLIGETVRRLTGTTTPTPAGARPPTGSIDIVSTTDADDEVRVAVRAIVDAARAGVRFDRMAVLWPTDRPYARLVEHHLTATGVPWNGRPGTTTGERAVPRVLAELLDLDRRGLRRTNLMTLLGDVPARGADGRPVPTARWERIGRRAGIIREADWGTHLPRYLDDARGRGSGDAEAGEALRAFVTELGEALGDRAAVRRWAEWVDWSYERLERWFGRRAIDRLDDDERPAWEQTQRVLDRLRHLDSIGGPVDRAEFRATFVAELDVTPARHGTVGDGIHIGLQAGAGGLDVDMVAVLGAAEGLLPPPPAVDPLLGDSDRRVSGLTTADERAEMAHRQFLAAVTTTPSALVTVPRGDLRVTTLYHPSRWLADLPAGGPVRTIDSHAHGLATAVFPVSPAEHRVRELWTSVCAGTDLRTHPLAASDAVLARAIRLRDARASDAFTEYDGALSGCEVPRLDRVVSPTRIEAWPRCPHAYFVHYLLGVRAVDEPEEIVSITALDRGSAIHLAIHRLQRAVLDGEVPAPGTAGWTPAHAELLARAAGTVADELEAAGRTGRVAYWANERGALLDELARWIEADRQQWQGRSIRCSEQSFGDDDPVAIALPDGRKITFRGQIDRIDELPDGTLMVTDHKTGRADDYTCLTDDDPTVGGTRFQLPVYAAAARVLLRRPDAPVRAEYAFFAKGNFRRIGITLDDKAFERVGEDLAHVVAGIESGVFPNLPDQPGWQPFVSCEYCQPDRLGTAERWAEWTRKRHDPRLARWFPETAP
jgi:hypothetical protein